MPQFSVSDSLIVALDVPNALAAGELTEKLGDTVSFYKIGLGMLTGGGLALAMELKDAGKRVFIDLKLFDIGVTVEAAVRGLAQFEMDFLTVHGDPYVVRAAVAGRGNAPTKILAVTILTSLERSDLDSALIREGTIPDLVVERARLAFEAGADGVIASPAGGSKDPRLARGQRQADRHSRCAPCRSRARRPETRRDACISNRRRCRSSRHRSSDPRCSRSSGGAKAIQAEIAAALDGL